MAVRPELRLRLPNSPGALARIVALLAAERVHLVAFSLESSGLLHLIVDHPTRGASVLAEAHLAVERREVIVTLVSIRSVGPLLATTASAGVNVEYAYTSSPEADGLVAVVLGVEDPQRAAATAGV